VEIAQLMHQIIQRLDLGKMNSYQRQKLRKAILSNIEIIIDSREQKNSHIIDFLNDNKIPHIQRKLDFGDYSFKIKKYTLESYFAIERKNSLDELIQNSIENDTTDSEINRIERELLRAKESESYLEIIIENNSYDDIFENNYNSMMNINAVLGKINKYKFVYDCNIQFIERNIGEYILNTCLGWAINNLAYSDKIVFRNELLKDLGVIK
jgi:ERCC4-type nuclease